METLPTTNKSNLTSSDQSDRHQMGFFVAKKKTKKFLSLIVISVVCDRSTAVILSINHYNNISVENSGYLQCKFRAL